MNNKEKNIIEITWILKEYAVDNHMQCITYEELKNLIVEIAERFETIYSDSDWNELNYNIEILNFTNNEIAKELWRRFSDIPMNPDTEEIEVEWNDFLVGTLREDIWHWFEYTFHVSVADDLMDLTE